MVDFLYMDSHDILYRYSWFLSLTLTIARLHSPATVKRTTIPHSLGGISWVKCTERAKIQHLHLKHSFCTESLSLTILFLSREHGLADVSQPFHCTDVMIQAAHLVIDMVYNLRPGRSALFILYCIHFSEGDTARRQVRQSTAKTRHSKVINYKTGKLLKLYCG